MKLTLVLLTAFLFSASATVVSQNVSYSGAQVRLESIFPSVEKQTGYVFIYKKTTLQAFKPITIKAENVPLDKFLQLVFHAQMLQYVIKGKNILVFPKPEPIAQNSPSIDSVPDESLICILKDAKGNPIAGVSAVLQPINKGTVTDQKGQLVFKKQ